MRPVARELTPVERAVNNTLASGSADAARTLKAMAEAAGWNVTLPFGTDRDMLADHNSRRNVFGHIFDALSLTPAGRAALTEALIVPQFTEESEDE